jgi:(p)ppGpp synthase/HD superfamily hydrolase
MSQSMDQNLYPPLAHRALEYAAIKHSNQVRKHPHLKIPYISHVACVGLILARAGYGDDVVAAGILHDVIEDCGVSQPELAQEFTPRIANLVEQVSEPGKEKSWHERKQAYFEKLQSAETDAVAIAAADHMHNLISLKLAYQADPKAGDMFKVGLGEKMDNERRIAQLFNERLGGPLAQEFAEALDDFVAQVKA